MSALKQPSVDTKSFSGLESPTFSEAAPTSLRGTEIGAFLQEHFPVASRQADGFIASSIEQPDVALGMPGYTRIQAIAITRGKAISVKNDSPDFTSKLWQLAEENSDDLSGYQIRKAIIDYAAVSAMEHGGVAIVETSGEQDIQILQTKRLFTGLSDTLKKLIVIHETAQSIAGNGYLERSYALNLQARGGNKEIFAMAEYAATAHPSIDRGALSLGQQVVLMGMREQMSAQAEPQAA